MIKTEKLITACAMHRKHILAEKPVGVDPSKIKTYLDLCEEQGNLLSVVSHHRSDPHSRKDPENIIVSPSKWETILDPGQLSIESLKVHTRMYVQPF